MSPEQLAGRPATVQSDLDSLGLAIAAYGFKMSLAGKPMVGSAPLDESPLKSCPRRRVCGPRNYIRHCSDLQCHRRSRSRGMKNVRVEIFDQAYSLRGNLDEKYVAQLAATVDEKMRSVAASTRAVDSLRIAVLAAINLADELHAARERIAELEGPLRKRAERCLTLVNQALQRSA
jgi:cell division protein ZapA